MSHLIEPAMSSLPARFSNLSEKAVLTPHSKEVEEVTDAPNLEISRANIFTLITEVLPLEICLYHRVLPLERVNTSIVLGMVDPSDREALAYVERMVSYQGLTLTPVLLPGAVHQRLLSAYLHHVGQPAAIAQDTVVAGTVAPSPVAPGAVAPGAVASGAVAPGITEQSPESLDPEETVFSPEEKTLFTPPRGKALQSASGESRTDHSMLTGHSIHPPKVASSDELLAELTAAPEPPTLSQPVEHRSTLFLDVTHAPPLEATFSPELELPLGEDPPILPTPPVDIVLPPLQVEHHYLVEPIEELTLLPPSQFLAELLGRIFAHGITRVLFGSTGGPGRIAWDWNGSAQLALGQIDPERFRALMAELKRLVGLPAEPVQQLTRRIVVRSFERQPVMLKLSIEPIGRDEMCSSPLGPGEKIQMQVLRGARLIAHEQNRLTQLEQEALETANLLRRKLQQMRIMRQTLPALHTDAEALSAVATVTRQNAAALPALTSFEQERGSKQSHEE